MQLLVNTKFSSSLSNNERNGIFAEHPQLYKEKDAEKNGLEPRPNDSNPDAAVRRQAATDEIMLERFRKRERFRVRR